MQTGGHIEILSKIGEGTTVKLYLPRATHQEEEPREAPKTNSFHGRGETILVVEDNEIVRIMVTQGLRELGYQYREAANAQTATRFLSQT